MNDGQLVAPGVLGVSYSEWLIARRRENQATSIRLHSLIRQYSNKISQSEPLIETTKSLVAVASCLWRAAYLSDRLAIHEDFEEEDFHLSDHIIEFEITDKPSSRSASEQAFFTYMRNAHNALAAIAATSERSVPVPEDILPWRGLSLKDCWIRHQDALDRAVQNFETALTR